MDNATYHRLLKLIDGQPEGELKEILSGLFFAINSVADDLQDIDKGNRE